MNNEVILKFRPRTHLHSNPLLQNSAYGPGYPHIKFLPAPEFGALIQLFFSLSSRFFRE